VVAQHIKQGGVVVGLDLPQVAVDPNLSHQSSITALGDRRQQVTSHLSATLRTCATSFSRCNAAAAARRRRGGARPARQLAVALQNGLQRLLTWGVVGTPLTADLPDIHVVQALLRALVRDSVGLSSADRERNIVGRVNITKPVEGLAKAVLVVDDIVTTGATANESVRVLQIAGAQVAGVLAIANA
jgi:phosphoribosylpyrophosphate synthetase